MRFSSFQFETFDAGAPMRPVKPTASAKPKKMEVAEPPPPPPITEQDVEQARKEGYSQGFLQGADEERKKIDRDQETFQKALLGVMQSVSSGLNTLGKEYSRNLAKTSSLLPDLVLTIARKIIGRELRQTSLPSLQQTVQNCLLHVMDEPRLVVYVHPDLLHQAESDLKNIAQQEGYAGTLDIKADEMLAPEDCRIEWKNGSLERNQKQILTQVEAMLGQQGDLLRSRPIPPAAETAETNIQE